MHAESLLEHADTAKRAVQDLVCLSGGRLTIGTTSSVSAFLLPQVISVFRKRHPLAELALCEGTSEAVAQWMETERVEFGIVQLPTGSGSFDEHPLFAEPSVALIAKTNPKANQKTSQLAKLAVESFILYKGRARDTAFLACREAGFEPRIACESSELETIRSLVAAGLGIAILPQLATTPPPQVAPSSACMITRLNAR